ncbi:hypothetical protein RM704_21405 [Streptomyces sp. DSM 3412]|uniref:LysR substrate-binding domain-containing protein n=1 Tax=Streptomyces gottesmaniae TaxID=3075518 RepID=A0ABU2Z086_9ACTN|nr:hypothetical protein [Streptomyces sp. DSM 3412]MDT0569997.1 hypothetical protein [Streptomyces sp. DSM 3412]
MSRVLLRGAQVITMVPGRPDAEHADALIDGDRLRLHDYSRRRDLEEAVRGGQGDIAVGPRPHLWEGPVHSLGYEEMVVIGYAEYPPGASASPAELAAADWVL